MIIDSYIKCNLTSSFSGAGRHLNLALRNRSMHHPSLEILEGIRCPGNTRHLHFSMNTLRHVAELALYSNRKCKDKVISDTVFYVHDLDVLPNLLNTIPCLKKHTEKSKAWAFMSGEPKTGKASW